jgi:hypothetical protein
MQIHSILPSFKWNLIFTKSTHLFIIISSAQQHGAQMGVGKMQEIKIKITIFLFEK